MNEEYDRIKKWQEFSQYMETEYLDRTIAKYGKQRAPDLMQVTPIMVCIWNIIKYAFRLWNGKGKGREFEKIAHYAQIAWTKEILGKEKLF